MQRVKEQKGITLIALVITIIVMLILVGVTVTVSLNGGLFTTAKQATKETQIAQEKEELLMATLGTLNENGKVDFNKLDSNLPQGFTGSNGQYTSKTGNTFTVSENGSITLGENQSEELITITFIPGDGESYFFYSLTKDDSYIYCEKLDSYEITVPAGSKVEKPYRGFRSAANPDREFPKSIENYLELLNISNNYLVTIDQIPKIVVKYDLGLDSYKDSSGQYIDMDSFYPTEDMTIYCYND